MMSIGSHILPTGSPFYFLNMARRPDLPIVTFSLSVVIFLISPLDGRVPVVLVSLPVVIIWIFVTGSLSTGSIPLNYR